MCLEITLMTSQPLGPRLEEISGEGGRMYICEEKNWLGRPTGFLIISPDSPGSCACNMLTDNSDWGAEYWEFHESALESFANTVKKIGEYCPKGFSLEAFWVGEVKKMECRLSLQELVDVIMANKVETLTQYIVLAT
jgi:hypothetical protein